MSEQDLSRVLFSQIVQGKTLTTHSFYKQLYIKHFSYMEMGELDEQYNKFLYEATSEGIPTYSEREESIIKDGLWSKSKELDLIQNQKTVSDMRITISRDYLSSRRKMLREQIKDIQKEVNKLTFEKNFHIGSTAESYANRRLTFYRISNSFFSNRDLSHQLVSICDDEIPEKHYSELINLYNDFQNKFNSNNISKIAISPFFTSIFYLSPEDAYSFYGKPMVELTTYQADLFGAAKHFRNILSQRPDIPKEIYSNPEELMEWVEINRAADEAKIFDDESNERGGAMSIPGATKDDLRLLGATVSDKMTKVNKKLKEKDNKTLSATELYNLTQ